MTEDKPNFEHPQSQSLSPTPFSSPSPQKNEDIATELRAYIDRRIQDHIHNGTISPRINANTDIIGTVGSIVYGGHITGSAAGTPFPNGWSVTHVGTGDYTITHHLGTTNYSVFATLGSIVGYINCISKLANSCDITTHNTSAAATDMDFDFLIIPS